MTTPMRAQYLALKRQYPDVILLFRLGDFYETFDDDARTVSGVCDVVLTSRPVGPNLRVPLAGVPYHAVDGYIAKLINAGYKVAIAEQVGSEPPAGEKLVPRVVRRVVTPGTLTEPAMLPEKRNNYLAALCQSPGSSGLAYVDISTGEFAATQIDEGAAAPGSSRVEEEIGRLQPAELLFPADDPRWARAEDASEDARLPQGLHATAYGAWHFEEATAQQALMDLFGVSTLDGFGCDGKPLAVRAAGALVAYLRETQMGSLPQLQSLRTYSTADYMLLDEPTRRSLELTESVRGGSVKGSLLGVLDATRTPMGARLLRRRLGQPLVDVKRIERRLEQVDAWFSGDSERAELRGQLAGFGDLERWTNRAVARQAQPRELLGMCAAIQRARSIFDAAESAGTPTGAGASLDVCEVLAAHVGAALADDPPAILGTPGVIREGYSPELDGVYAGSRTAREWIAGLEPAERQRTGIKSLKVGFNKVFGYYLEVSNANVGAVPADYVRKQTLVNAERYITSELKEYESLVLNAETRILELERQLYGGLLDRITESASALLDLAAVVGEIDVAAALAEVARSYRYVRPELGVDLDIMIRAGRHPVVERLAGEPFVPNDLRLSSEESIVILTGPNMSGKSTYIRQAALIVLMAQIGSYVPADFAHVGLSDRIFTRIGASDDISRGRSTFMVEMVETANILHHATPRSLLVLDEIGRGTSTYDGLAIAWAILEYIHNNPDVRSRTLFATHYHELTDLPVRLPHIRNYNVAVAEEGDRVAFLHRIEAGAADRSYGVHVAQLAGLPRSVVRRAADILADLEASGAAGPRRSIAPAGLYQLPLFAGEDPVLADLKALDVNGLSPLDALNKLYELQQRARG